jgi:hypothetical protein
VTTAGWAGPAVHRAGGLRDTTIHVLTSEHLVHAERAGDVRGYPLGQVSEAGKGPAKLRCGCRPAVREGPELMNEDTRRAQGSGG